ncbi:U6 snRNA phosphodiesterase isoform X2 [Eutrema salsugineum]|uniref:U6 snRNA phosphodiesterase isoform X2 n=1 Tax=Eutrema salsugineum TaxID=72664 RepID=UPI000CED70BD|nr:U6 snRNA phosphodiesterase isoform X2 [Eutrema salsugineum]
MEALRATYGDSSSDSDTDDFTPPSSVAANSGEKSTSVEHEREPITLPPPPLSLLDSIGSTGSLDFFATEPGVRVRNFPHVDGNYALHVYIPVSIPLLPKKEIVCFLKRVASAVPNLHLVEADVPLSILCKDDQKLERALGREFHISLGRSVPLRVHQINSVVSLLRQKLQFHKRYWIDFNKWEVFVNDDCTRSFLSLEITTSGLSEICKQIDAVNEVYKLHNLPEFYKDPRPHISLVWALGDIRASLKGAVDRELSKLRAGGCLQNRIFTTKFCGIECKIGNKTHKICKLPDE